MNPITLLTDSASLYSRSDVLVSPCPVPAAWGVYSWFFKEVPEGVPTEGCITKLNRTLMYVGISPSNVHSRENLRKRIKYHYQGNAEGSTLRRTLGVLLAIKSNYPLRRVGTGKRMTFTHHGEQWLDDWMAKNAFVCWAEHATPWVLEKELLNSLALPLNIQENPHPFARELMRKRKQALQQARELPIASEQGQQRRSAVGAA